MPRIAVEAVIAAPFGDVRVITTHLEWYSRTQRAAQVEALRQIYADGDAHARDGQVTMDEEGGPFQTFLRPRATIVTGDFNLEYADPLHARMIAPFPDGTPALTNVWDALRPGQPYPATFMEPNGPELHCDFIFASRDLLPRLADIRIDQQTQASDHQPVMLTLR